MGRTIQTCSLLLLVVALVPTGATARRIEPSAMGAYVRARVADRAGDSAVAVANYSAALTMASDATMVAFRAYRSGVDTGDFALALRAAQALDKSGIVPPDARVLLYVAAVRDRDWRMAAWRLDQMAGQEGFDFLAPLLRGSLALATGDKLPEASTRATAYDAENNILLGIVRGDAIDSVAAVKGLWSSDPYRATTLRLVAAATFAARKRRPEALQLLVGDDPTIAGARALAGRGKRLPGAVDTPARSASFILARMAGDLMNENSLRSAITMARFATFADPSSPNVKLVTATALGLVKRDVDALALIEEVARDPVYGDLAWSLRIDRLEALGRMDEAYAQAAARADRSVNDLTRVGDIEARRGRYAEAARHYRRALDQLGADKAGAPLWLALGNALDRSGDWTGARPAFERALAQTPADPRLLNQLGYGMAVRGEDIERALGLLHRAAAAQPDNAAITDSIGWAEFKGGRIDRAVATLERARVLDPIEPDFAEHLGDAYWTTGRRIEARYAWAAAREAATGAAQARIEGKIDRGLP